MEAKNCELQTRVEAIDKRVDALESAVLEMRREQESGFRELTSAVNMLGHDFGERMNTLDKRIVAEKEKWGDVLRRVVLWSAITILGGACVAMGISAYKNFHG